MSWTGFLPLYWDRPPIIERGVATGESLEQRTQGIICVEHLYLSIMDLRNWEDEDPRGSLVPWCEQPVLICDIRRVDINYSMTIISKSPDAGKEIHRKLVAQWRWCVI